MKKISIFILLIFSMQAFAFKTSTLKNVEFNYQLPTGILKVETFLFPSLDINWQSIDLGVRLEENSFIISSGARDEVTLSNLPNYIIGNNKILLEKLNLTTTENELNINFNKLEFYAKGGDLLIHNLKAKCLEKNSEESSMGYVESVLFHCLTNGNLDAKKVVTISHQNSVDQESNDLSLILTNSITTAFLKSQKIDKEDYQNVMEDLKMVIKKSKFNLEAYVHAQVSGKVKMSGLSSYLTDTEQIKIRLDKATFGWFNIKEEIFSELEKDTSGKIKVERPYIYMKL